MPCLFLRKDVASDKTTEDFEEDPRRCRLLLLCCAPPRSSSGRARARFIELGSLQHCPPLLLHTFACRKRFLNPAVHRTTSFPVVEKVGQVSSVGRPSRSISLHRKVGCRGVSRPTHMRDAGRFQIESSILCLCCRFEDFVVKVDTMRDRPLSPESQYHGV